MNPIILQCVKFVPRNLSPGILYVSEEYAVAVHLCACGCGNKVTTPLGPTEWSFSQRNGLATVRPSVGNWQLPCRSHYLIIDGRIHWAGQWSDAEIASGRKAEAQRRQTYYEQKDHERKFWVRVGKWLRKIIGI